MKKLFAMAALGLLLGSGLASVPASAANVGLYINTAPPAPREEVVPAPRHGYVWAPGYYRWAGHRHVWVAGHWVRERRGYHWVAPAWEPHDRDRYEFHRGHWDRD